jgi:hypothetical protein
LSQPSDTPSSNSEGRTFRVTHAFHPLSGQALELVTSRQNWGNAQVYYHDDAGRLRQLPITWTSLSAEDPVVVTGAGRSPFKLADLLELAHLLEQLQADDPDPLPQNQQAPDVHGGVK